MRRWLTLLIVLMGAMVARAQTSRVQVPIPAKETGSASVRATLGENDEFDVRDIRGNAPIVLSRGTPLVENFDPAIKAEVGLQEQPSGGDLVFRFTNTANEPKRLGMINIGIATIGRKISYWDFRDVPRRRAVDGQSFSAQWADYPDELYSPVFVLEGDKYTLGISLLYPTMSYKHDVRLSISSPGGRQVSGEGGRGWLARFQLGSIGDAAATSLAHDAELRPGETRTYVVCVRVMASGPGWQRTLTPYRNFFRELYGAVKYKRHPEAMQGIDVASESWMEPANPRGWNPDFRPDQRGWGVLVKHLRDLKAGGVLLRGQTGVTPSNGAPFQMATPWSGQAGFAELLDRARGLPSLPTLGTELALWWGRSCQVSVTFEGQEWEAFEPSYTDHVQASLAEMDAAVRAGATTVVLGGFRHAVTPIWTQYAWLRTLQNRYHKARFVIEPSTCDILHVVAPTMVRATMEQKATSPEAQLLIDTPHYLADLLVPGHETWASHGYAHHAEYFGAPADAEMVARDSARIADAGYVPLIWWDGTVPGRVLASESWSTSVPSDIKLDPRSRLAQTNGSAWDQYKSVSTPTSREKGKDQRKRSSGTVIVRPGSGEEDARVSKPPSEGEDAAKALQRARGQDSPTPTVKFKVVPNQKHDEPPDDGPGEPEPATDPR
ncbi:MAG: hypothetical protein IT432_09900 [Phycisphaerales bacterium]|nr:hypothetical protein [Phycisphaerales bacterium]